VKWTLSDAPQLTQSTLLKSYLENYTSLHVTIQEIATRGSFQIGVTSRIGGFKRLDSKHWLAQPPAKVILDREAPDQPTNRSDYYLITPNDPNQPRVVYRAEHVKQIEMQGTDAKSLEFTVYLTDDAPECRKAKMDCAICGKNALGKTPNGVAKPPCDSTSCCSKRYTNATIVRRDDLPGPRFCEDEAGNAYAYHGDPLLEVETPYQIDVLLSGPAQAGILAQIANEKAWLLEALYGGDKETTTHFAAIIQFLQPEERKRLLAVIDEKLAEKKEALGQRYAGIKQKPAFTELCRLACAEDALRARTGAQTTEIARYQPPVSTQPQSANSQGANSQNGQTRSYEQEIQRLRAVLDREKPAHVHYSLRFQEEPPPALPVMQIGVRSRIGVSMVIA
jgi:hypothetical protein